MIARLPAELSALVLDELAQPDVIRLAHVSKSWRVIAIHHSKFYASFTLVNSISRPAAPGVIETFCSDIVGAVACSARLDIWVDHRHRSKGHESEALRILDAIKLALPHLVRLDLQVDTYSSAAAATALRDVLQEPAPVLESLRLRSEVQFPTNFLDGAAPNLRTLALSDPGAFSFAPVFPSVQTVLISGRCDSLSTIGIKFPSVIHVHMASILATPDAIPLRNHIPTLRSLHFSAWSALDIPWLEVSEQTQSIPSLTAYIISKDALSTQYATAFMQCLGAGTSLSVFEVEEGYKHEIVFRFQSGGKTRTIMRNKERGVRQGMILLENIVPAVASRITHLTFDYLLLPRVAPAVAEHLSALKGIEVDLGRRLTKSDSLRHRDHRLCLHDVLQRRVVDPADFDKHRARIRAVCRTRYGTTSLALALKSRMPIWFPAHDVLALLLYLGLPSHVHVQNINLVLEGVVEEPEDAQLLRTVFSEVTYVSVAALSRSSV